jgi:hypothetical protein
VGNLHRKDVTASQTESRERARDLLALFVQLGKGARAGVVHGAPDELSVWSSFRPGRKLIGDGAISVAAKLPPAMSEVALW